MSTHRVNGFENKGSEARQKGGNPNWRKGGPSPNPGGRPKGLREFREALEDAGAPRVMIQVLLRGLAHEDVEVALAVYEDVRHT